MLAEDEMDPFLETGLPKTDTSEEEDYSVLMVNLAQYFPRYDVYLGIFTILTWVRFILYLRFVDPIIH